MLDKLHFIGEKAPTKVLVVGGIGVAALTGCQQSPDSVWGHANAPATPANVLQLDCQKNADATTTSGPIALDKMYQYVLKATDTRDEVDVQIPGWSSDINLNYPKGQQQRPETFRYEDLLQRPQKTMLGTHVVKMTLKTDGSTTLNRGQELTIELACQASE